jgi:hypothetical protein
MNTLNDLNSGRPKRSNDASTPPGAQLQDGPVCRLKLSQRLTVRWPVHLAKLLSNMARNEKTSPSDLVRTLVMEAVRARAELALGKEGGRQ